jgi:tetratricopeptide (TPR) repeat protein
MCSENSPIQESNDFWQMKVMGGFRLRSPHGQEFKTKSKLARQLLQLLAILPSNFVPRIELADMLFGSEMETRHDRLNVLISRLNSALVDTHSTFLSVSNDSVELNRSLIIVDTIQLEKTLNDLVCRASAGKSFTNDLQVIEDITGKLLPIREDLLSTQALNRYRSKLRHEINSRIVPALGCSYAHFIITLTEVLGLEDMTCPVATSEMMLICSALGEIGTVHRLFAEHEDYLACEFGTTVSQSVSQSYEFSLKRKPVPGLTETVGGLPSRPKSSFGLEQLLEQGMRIVNETLGGEVIAIVGGAGLGKSHYLAELAHRLSDRYCVKSIGSVSDDTSFVSLRSDSRELILIIDDAQFQKYASIRLKAIQLNARAVIVTTREAQEFVNSPRIVLKNLTMGSFLEPGSALQMMRDLVPNLERDKNSPQFAEEYRSLVKICSLANGVPQVIKVFAEVIAMLGIRSATAQIQQSFSTALGYQINEASRYVMDCLRKQVDELTVSQRQCCTMLSFVGGMLPIKPLTVSLNIPLSEIAALESAGIVTIQNGMVGLSKPYKSRPNLIDERILSEETYSEVCYALYFEIREISRQQPLLPDFAVGMPSYSKVGHWFLMCGKIEEACNLFEACSHWSSKVAIGNDFTSSIECVVVSSQIKNVGILGTTLGALGRVLFNTGQYVRMKLLLETFVAPVAFSQFDKSTQYRLLNQCGLACRSLGELDIAASYYTRARDFAVTSQNHLTLDYNLGCLYESQGEINLAYQYFTLGAKKYDESVDQRLLLENSIALLRLRQLLQLDDPLEEELSELVNVCSRVKDTELQGVTLMYIGSLAHLTAQNKLWYSFIGAYLVFEQGVNKKSATRVLPMVSDMANWLDECNGKVAGKRMRLLNQFLELVEHESITFAQDDYEYRGVVQIIWESLEVLRMLDSPMPAELTSFYDQCSSDFFSFSQSIQLSIFSEHLIAMCSSEEVHGAETVVPQATLY